jgi:DNA-binding MarR family transcriptional regulator
MTAPHDDQSNEAGRFAFDGLDRVLHEKKRLGILTSLLSHRDGLVFNELKELCTLTDGNLSRHLTILQEAGMIEVWKGTNGRRPQTLVRITDFGRTKFREYINVLESVVKDSVPTAEPTGKPFGRGWSPA